MRKHVAKLLIAVGFFIFPFNGHAMTVEQMKGLKGADMLGLRVDEIFTNCGLPEAIVDKGDNSANKKKILWGNVKMELSDGNWEIIYQNNRNEKIMRPANGWTNPNPAQSKCFSGLSRVILYTQGGIGIVKINKQMHKTTYSIPRSLYKSHVVIGLKVYLHTPISVAEIIRKYGVSYDVVESNKNLKIIRFWVDVEVSLMPTDLYAVDFEITNVNNTSVAYMIATTNFDFVLERHKMLMEQWEKYGID